MRYLISKNCICFQSNYLQPWTHFIAKCFNFAEQYPHVQTRENTAGAENPSRTNYVKLQPYGKCGIGNRVAAAIDGAAQSRGFRYTLARWQTILFFIGVVHVCDCKNAVVTITACATPAVLPTVHALSNKNCRLTHRRYQRPRGCCLCCAVFANTAARASMVPAIIGPDNCVVFYYNLEEKCIYCQS